ncbi:MAG: F0F1 ATP synthase subunit B [Gammaproteobacteria bacterium]|nr:F0F1 ATP synthase subunit B [Gammaproteobacteria bacterium]MDC3239640.1 F0F1 ATP synthase subunit B [Gammaproteobacteria bacterium]RZO94914.1 MAG: F0F1 ATP synthase subunit B [Gammaproteobacteria bacterium]
MSLNATLLIQMTVFAVVVLFSMKFIWPMIMEAIEERNKNISDGLAAAEQGQKKLSEAETEVNTLIKEAKQQATTILDQANTRASSIVESAKNEGTSERDKIISTAHDEAQQELAKLRETLRKEVAGLAISGAEKILTREISSADHKDMLDKLANKL